MSNQISTNRKILTLVVYGAFCLIGIAVTVFGPTIALLMIDYRVTQGQAGLLITFMALGRTVSVVFSGMLSDRFGSKWILIAGAAGLTIGLLGIGSSSIFIVATIFAIIGGVGHGAVDAAGSAVISELYPDKISSALNKTHMFYGLGCLIGPLVSGTVLSFISNWRVIYWINGIFGVLITILLILQPFPAIEKMKGKGSTTPFKMLLAGSSIWLLSLMMFLYSGAGYSINTWVNTYMGDVIKLSVFFASGTLAVYNLGLTVGRLVCSLVAERIGYCRLLLIGAAGGVIASACALFSSSTLMVVVGLGFIGFFFGGLFPTTVAIGGQMYPHQKGAITGILVMAAAFGGMVIPALTGGLSQSLGMVYGMRTLIIWSALMVVVAWLLQPKEGIKSSETICR